MDLGDRLQRALSHDYYYREIGGDYFLKRLLNSCESTQYVVDNSIFSNSTAVLTEVSGAIQTNKYYSSNVCSLVKCTYGQLKALYSLSTSNRLVISENIFSEFQQGKTAFNHSLNTLVKTLFNSDCDDEYLYRYLIKIQDLRFKLEDILPYCTFSGDKKEISRMVSQFKKSPFYQPTLKLKKKKEKKVSSNDLELFAISVYENNFSESNFLTTDLLCNDVDFQAQGLFIYDQKLLDTPDILSSEIRPDISRKFQFSFHRYRQPKIDTDILSEYVA